MLDSDLADAVRRMPTLQCGGDGGPHMLAVPRDAALQPLSPAAREVLVSRPPYVLKLSRHELPRSPRGRAYASWRVKHPSSAPFAASAAFEAVQLSLRPRLNVSIFPFEASANDSLQLGSALGPLVRCGEPVPHGVAAYRDACGLCGLSNGSTLCVAVPRDTDD